MTSMAKTEVTIHGKRYMVSCDDGQEEHLGRLAGYIDKRIAELENGSRNPASETHLFMMASLQIADELAALYNELDDLRRAEQLSDQLSSRIEATTARIESLTAQLQKSA